MGLVSDYVRAYQPSQPKENYGILTKFKMTIENSRGFQKIKTLSKADTFFSVKLQEYRLRGERGGRTG